jgi:hypothetical protein
MPEIRMNSLKSRAMNCAKRPEKARRFLLLKEPAGDQRDKLEALLRRLTLMFVPRKA